MISKNIAMKTLLKPFNPATKNPAAEEEKLLAAPVEGIAKKNHLKNSGVWVKETYWNKDTDESHYFSSSKKESKLECFEIIHPIIKLRSHRFNGKDKESFVIARKAILDKIEGKKEWRLSNFEGIKDAHFFKTDAGLEIFKKLLGKYPYLNRIGYELTLSLDPPLKNHKEMPMFVCKLTLTLLIDPITCHLGHSNERSRIKTRIENGNLECPNHRHYLVEKDIKKYGQKREFSYTLRLTDILKIQDEHSHSHESSKLAHDAEHFAHEVHAAVAQLEVEAFHWEHFMKHMKLKDIGQVLEYSAPVINEIFSTVISVGPIIGTVSYGVMGSAYLYSGVTHKENGWDISRGIINLAASASMFAPPPANIIAPACFAVINLGINIAHYFHNRHKENKLLSIELHLKHISHLETILGVKDIKNISEDELKEAKKQTMKLFETEHVQVYLKDKLKLNPENFTKAIKESLELALDLIKSEEPIIHVPEFTMLEMLNPYLNTQINSFNEKGYTPLHLAIINNDMHGVIQLVSLGGDLNVMAKNEKGYTPLQEAVSHNNLEAAEYLLKKGALKEFDETELNTPLYLAFFHKHKEMVDLLITQGVTLDRSTHNHCNLYFSGSKNPIEKEIFRSINNYALKLREIELAKRKEAKITDAGVRKRPIQEKTEEAKMAHKIAATSFNRNFMETAGISSHDSTRWSESLEYQAGKYL